MATKSCNILLTLINFAIFVAILSDLTAAQDCGCAANLCCSRYGYCGSDEAYCGMGCQEGPCFASPLPNNVSVSDIVTAEFFDNIINETDSSCPGKSFYTRSAFLQALDSYPLFGREGSSNDSKREIAAFFAHVSQATGRMCMIEEIDVASKDYCQESNKKYPCVVGKSYYGRGPIQLSWNYNYGPAGDAIGFDGLNHPETVSADNVISFKTALWFWMNNVHSVVVSGKGFSQTVRAINGNFECDGVNYATVAARVDYYVEYCNRLGIAPGDDLYC